MFQTRPAFRTSVYISTLLFLEDLRRNQLLLRADGEPLADNAMVMLALLVAESDPKQKDLMIR